MCFNCLVEVGFCPSLLLIFDDRWMKLPPTSHVLLESIVFHESSFSNLVKKVLVTGREEEDGTEVGRTYLLVLSNKFHLPEVGKTAREPTVWPADSVFMLGSRRVQVHEVSPRSPNLNC